MTGLIPPHGGQLVNRILSASDAAAAVEAARSLPALTLSAREACDLEMLAIGAFSPLVGFMGRRAFESVCRDMRLPDGTVWPIPITLCPPEEAVSAVREGRPPLADGHAGLAAVRMAYAVYQASATGQTVRL